ncbi:unnamed protein product [Hyaloperonospora brassicae]|uniref:RxLR effector protein n=1 Tax=Hyaloperonospora brassicae TaxID=162125 RepID=A0AAV0T2I3_HYABA|nr:unnamed protein product [Hyaloperonospora brassicae]
MRLTYIAAVALTAVFASSAAVSTAGDPQPAVESDVSFVNRVTDGARHRADTKRLLRARAEDDSAPMEAEDEARNAGFLSGFTNVLKNPALKNLPSKAKTAAANKMFRINNIVARVDVAVDNHIASASQKLKKLGNRPNESALKKKLTDQINYWSKFDAEAWVKSKF